MRVGKKYIFTKEQEDYMRAHYPTEATCDIAERFRVSPPVVKRKAEEMGLVKSESYDQRNFHNRWVKTYKDIRYSNFVR